MNDRITNSIESFRGRIVCLDKPENTLIWENQPPVAFTEKASQARIETAALVAIGARQSAALTGSAADKRREEKQLEDEAYQVAGALITYCTDTHDLTTAAKYDFPISTWRALRDEALLEKARLLMDDVNAIITGPDSVTAIKYGLIPAALAKLTQEALDYENFIVAPRAAITERSTLTADLAPKVRALATLFDQLDSLSLQFRGTPAGDAFVAAWLASGQIFDRGHGPATPPPPPVPPVP